MTSSRPSEQETPTPSRMWPVDYILQSSYSPLHLEGQIPKRQWREAFEDLLALETNDEMISLESRKREAEMGIRINYGILSHVIYLANRGLRNLARERKGVLDTREEAILGGDLRVVSWLNESLSMVETRMEKIIEGTKQGTQLVEAMKKLPASRLRTRGTWIASLISSGVLPGWKSRLEGGARRSEQRICMQKMTDPPVEPEETKDIVFTDEELRNRFGRAPSSNYKIPSGGIDYRYAGQRFDEVTVNEHLGRGRSSSGPTQSWPYLTFQTTTSERVLLPDGSTINKVVLTNHFLNGKEEKIEIIQDAAKVLEEVEKARLLLEGLEVVSW
ncbi:MAG: hypothetical protein Q9161_009421 [Pseudevernia consocians]